MLKKIDIAGETLTISIEQGKSRVRGRIVPGLYVTRVILPRSLGSRATMDFVRENGEQILKSHKKLLSSQNGLDLPIPPRVECGMTMPLLGQVYQIKFINSPKRSLKHEIVDNHITIECRDTSNLRLVYKALYRMLSSELGNYIRLRVNEISANMTFDIQRISIKKMSSRWASCSSKRGNLNFSTYLGFLPLDIIDYIIFHELAHFKHQHHQKEFYQHLGELLPDWNRCETWLRHYGHLIMSMFEISEYEPAVLS